MSKTLSISIAAYNIEKYIGECMDSLLVPEVLDDIEIIVVNDGSKDSTAAIVEKYAAEYPGTVVFINKENGGYGSTINASVKVATGKYYKLLDGDDWFESANLTEFIGRLKQCSCDMVLTQYTRVYEDVGLSTKLFEENYEYGKVLPCSVINRVTMPSITVKTELLQRNSMQITEKCFYTDVEFLCKVVSYSENFMSIPLNVYLYRCGRPGQSSYQLSNFLNHIEDHLFIIEKAVAICDGNPSCQSLMPHLLELTKWHLQCRVSLPAKNANIKTFKRFCRLLESHFPDFVDKMDMRYKIAYICPELFYKPLCIYRRKKHNIDSESR